MEAILLALAAVGVVFIACLLGTAAGAAVGWIVGLVFDDSLALLAKALGIAAAPYQLGAIFGFVGSFFRSTVSAS